MRLDQYWKVQSIIEKPDLSPENKSNMIIAIMHDLTVDQLLQRSVDDYLTMSRKSQEELTSLEQKAKANDKYVIDGNEFKLIRSGKQMNAIQFIHLMSLMQLKDMNKRLHSICALMLIPVENGKSFVYPDYNIAAIEQLVAEYMDICDIFAIVGEASGLFSEFPKPIRDYLGQVKKEKKIADRGWRRSPIVKKRSQA